MNRKDKNQRPATDDRQKRLEEFKANKPEWKAPPSQTQKHIQAPRPRQKSRYKRPNRKIVFTLLKVCGVAAYLGMWFAMWAAGWLAEIPY